MELKKAITSFEITISNSDIIKFLKEVIIPDICYQVNHGRYRLLEPFNEDSDSIYYTYKDKEYKLSKFDIDIIQKYIQSKGYIVSFIDNKLIINWNLDNMHDLNLYINRQLNK